MHYPFDIDDGCLSQFFILVASTTEA